MAENTEDIENKTIENISDDEGIDKEEVNVENEENAEIEPKQEDSYDMRSSIDELKNMISDVITKIDGIARMRIDDGINDVSNDVVENTDDIKAFDDGVEDLDFSI